MSKVSIIGASNTRFGSFVQRNKETGEVTDTASLYTLMIEVDIALGQSHCSAGG